MGGEKGRESDGGRNNKLFGVRHVENTSTK